jgi:signal transduction histidine kinase
MKKFFERISEWLRKIKLFRSLRFRITILILLVGIVCCVVMRYGILSNYFLRAVEVRTSDVQSQMQILADHLISYNYLQDASNDVVNAEIEQVANLYDGRIMVIGRNFGVVKDTYGVASGKLIISEEVIKTFRGEFISHFDEANHYIELTVPIKGTLDGKSETLGVILASVSTTPIDQNVDILSRNSYLFMFSLLILTLLVAVFSPHILLKPFNRLSDAISEVKSGFTDEKIEVNDYNETEHIADSFNQVMDRMRVIEESRQEFVANVSHELKTPLTSVKLLADSLISQDNAPVEIYKDFMSDIVEEIDRENKIINDLLSLVKMDKKSMDLNIAQVDVNALIESVFKRLLPIAQNKKVDLIFETVRQVTAELDEVKFTLAITNLIENGIKYNHEEGYVKVNLDADYQNFTVTVSDSGMGIPEEDQKNIFERFYRVDKSHSREIGGTGLGLSITRSAILMHRGTIKVESEEDIGTTFTIKVPLIYSSGSKPAVEVKEEEPVEELTEEEIEQVLEGELPVEESEEESNEEEEDEKNE